MSEITSKSPWPNSVNNTLVLSMNGGVKNSAMEMKGRWTSTSSGICTTIFNRRRGGFVARCVARLFTSPLRSGTNALALTRDINTTRRTRHHMVNFFSSQAGLECCASQFK
jgi:hypothetical protein